MPHRRGIVEHDAYEVLEARASVANKRAYDLLCQLSETPTRSLVSARIKARLAADMVGEIACLFRVVPGWRAYCRVRSSHHIYQRVGPLPIFRVRRRKRD